MPQTGSPPQKHPDHTGAPRWRRGAFRLGIAATPVAFAIVAIMSLLPTLGTYAEAWLLTAQLGVIVLFVAGLGWIVAVGLRRRN